MDIEKVRELVKLVEQSGIEELEIINKDTTIRIQKSPAAGSRCAGRGAGCQPGARGRGGCGGRRRLRPTCPPPFPRSIRRGRAGRNCAHPSWALATVRHRPPAPIS